MENNKICAENIKIDMKCDKSFTHPPFPKPYYLSKYLTRKLKQINYQPYVIQAHAKE